MGNKISAVNGVKSSDFYQPGNAVNEIWWGDTEVVSRLPFGDSDMGQAGWPKGEWPKIPWRPFIIPLRAAAQDVIESRAVSPDLLRCQQLAGPFKNEPNIMPAAICWIATQILIVPIAAVPIFLNASPDITWTLSSRCIPCRKQPDIPRRLEVHPAKLKSAALLHAIIGTIFYLMALPLVIFDGFAISASRFCRPLSSSGRSHSALWGLAYALYAGVSGTLIIAATWSVVRLWMKYFKIKACNRHERCPGDEEDMKETGEEVILAEVQTKGKQKEDETGNSDTPLSVEELESIAADTFWDIESSPAKSFRRFIPGLS
ncbi:hypothetical protein FQN54_005624 [Arachnomyces sp. PD_36]|nr:hypothetical protein FQN54_005624 [Arachnomyces sp. PD_36]